MPAPTVDDLETVLEYRCGDTLADVGRFLDGPGGATVAFREALRKGLEAVGIAPAAPFGPLLDADLAHLTAAASLRVLDEAERSALRRARDRWHVTARAAGVPEFAPAGEDGAAAGWRAQDWRQLVARLAELDRDLARPYREPGPPLVVNPPSPSSYVSGPACCRGSRACR